TCCARTASCTCSGMTMPSRRRSVKCGSYRTACSRRGMPPAPPPARPPAPAEAAPAPTMDSGDIPLILIAALSALAAAGFGCVDAALTRVSRVSVEEFARQGRPGAARLATVVADPGRYLALLLLLRVGGEMVAAACITVMAVHAYGAGFAA